MADASRPSDLRYSESHEWVRIEGEMATVGITDFAVEHLSDLTFLQLPEVGADVSAGEAFGEIESVKAVSDLNAPVSGEVTDVNEDLADNLETLNDAPFDGGWMVKIKMSDPSEAEKLMDLASYEDQIRKEEEEG